MIVQQQRPPRGPRYLRPLGLVDQQASKCSQSSANADARVRREGDPAPLRPVRKSTTRRTAPAAVAIASMAWRSTAQGDGLALAHAGSRKARVEPVGVLRNRSSRAWASMAMKTSRFWEFYFHQSRYSATRRGALRDNAGPDSCWRRPEAAIAERSCRGQRVRPAAAVLAAPVPQCPSGAQPLGRRNGVGPQSQRI